MYPGQAVNNFSVPTGLFKDVAVPISAHNMKFDWQHSVKEDLMIPTDNLWCTMMMSVYIDENHIPGHDLDAVLFRYLGERKKKMEAKTLMKFGWEQAPVEYMAQYCIQDVDKLPELRNILLSQMTEKQIQLWEQVDRPFMLLLAEIESRGIPIDYDLCERYEQQSLHRLKEIQEQLGFDPAKPSQLHPRLFSVPPVGLGLSVPSRTPTGKPQVSLDWLESVGHPTTALIYEYRKTAKQLSSYFSAYLRLTTRDYARLHPNFKQHGTETGRLSCESPNLQQIPREEYKDAYVKKLFLPEQGKQLWEIDYRTIEYRLQAVYAQSAKLLQLFADEGDFHQLVADDVSDQTGLSITRFKAKTINYLMSFGGGVKVLQKQLGVSYKDAEKIHAGYKASYPDIFWKAAEAAEYAERHMEVDMWSGRTRHFKFPSETHKAFNAVIQGGAFEIVKRSMLRLREEGYTISNQVHDSVWLNVDSEKDVIAAQSIMEDWTLETFGLKFSTDRKRLN